MRCGSSVVARCSWAAVERVGEEEQEGIGADKLLRMEEDVMALPDYRGRKRCCSELDPRLKRRIGWDLEGGLLRLIGDSREVSVYWTVRPKRNR